MGVIMKDLPQIVPKKNLRYHWWYKNEEGKSIALVVRYDDPENPGKKYFHQYRLNENNEWEEGVAAPSPLFGIESLNNRDYDENIHIFEGEKCVNAAHPCGLIALTSMMGANQVQNADWAILAKHRNFKQFVLIPDNDDPGKNYMQTVYREIRRTCPNASIKVCFLPHKQKGDDFVDWLQSQDSCPKNWDGFSIIKEPFAKALGNKFKSYVRDNLVPIEDFLKNELEVVFNGDPEPITEILSNVLPCPIQTFPTSIQRWMTAIADSMQVPLDYLAAPFIVYAGSVIGRKRGLLLRANTKWVEYANLWGMSIGRPGAMKSPPMKAVQGPLKKLAEQAKREFRTKSLKHKEELKFWKLLEKEQSKAYQEGIREAFKEAHNIKCLSIPHPQIIDEPKAPICKRYKTQDATIEKIGELLKDNPQGLLIYRDEINGWLNGFRKKGRENDRAFYIEGWSGNEDWDVDRIQRGSMDVPPMCFSIFGSIQPGPISKYVNDTIRGGIGDDGFLQRFQAVVWPDQLSDWKLINSPPIEPLEQEVLKIFEFLDTLHFDEEGNPILIPFSKEAQPLFDSWQQNWEAKIRKGNLPEYLESHLGKYKKLIGSLVLIFEHLHVPMNLPPPSEGSKNSLEIAMVWLDYFESHAIRLYNCGLNTVPKAAKDLLRKISEGKLQPPFSVRDVYYSNHWSGLSNAEQVTEVLNYLVEKKHLTPKVIRLNGERTITKYLVHQKSNEYI